MKKYVAVNVCTPDERGATGFADEIKVFNSMEDAKAYIKEQFEEDRECESDELNFDERRILDCETMEHFEQLRAVYHDYNSNYVEWKVVEVDV